MNKDNNQEFIINLGNPTFDENKNLVSEIKQANLYVTRYSKEHAGRIEKLFIDGTVELLPSHTSLLEARKQQREDSIKAGLSGII
jgi:hypothetical protein